ncbi:MAG: hypothetical protein ACRDRO_21335 [Pseudonocardiaceae bacterium]
MPVMQMLRRLGAMAVFGAIALCLLAVWRSPNRIDLSTFWALVVGVVAAIAAVITVIPILKETQARYNGGQGDEWPLEDLVDRLARAVKKQWTDVAMDRRLVQSDAISVRWELSSRGLVGPVSAAVGSRRLAPVPGLGTVGEEQLRRGGLGDLHAVYGGLGSGRLVIVGSPGAGKTGAGVLLVLRALEYREHLLETDRAGVPIPVMFTVHGWDPNTQRVQDWLVSRLRQTYPLFAGKGGAARAADLLQAGKIAVILDGLDEIVDELQPVALQALSEQAAFRLVILSRSAEMTTAAQRALLEGAVAIELQDVVPAAAADYLTRVQLSPPPAGWRELTDRLCNQPDSPIAQALSNPLTLTLVRDTYSSGDSVRELLEIGGNAEHPVSREDIENHLLDRVLPAAYTARPGQALPRYDLRTAQRALNSIATRMNRDGSRDLAWWRISAWTATIPRIVVGGLAVAVLSSFVVGLQFGFIRLAVLTLTMTGLLFGLLFGLAGGLVFRFVGSSPQRIAPPRWRSMVSRSSLMAGLRFGLLLGIVAGVVAVLVFGVVFGVELGIGIVRDPDRVVDWTTVREELGVELLVGLVFGVVGVFVGVLLSGLFRPGTDDASPPSPLASWRRDRAVGPTVGLVLVLVVALVVGVRVEDLDLASYDFGLLGAGGLVGGLVGGLMSSTTWTASLVFAQLARRWHTPIRLMRFLEDARQRDVLRTVGPVYQFRHARLQDRLAARVERTTDMPNQTPVDRILGEPVPELSNPAPMPKRRRQRVVIGALLAIGVAAASGVIAVWIPIALNTVRTPSVTATIPVGTAPFGVAITPDGRHAYITNSGSYAAPGTTVSVIDTARNTVTATIDVGRESAGVAITPDGAHAYITNYQARTVSVIDTASNTVTATIGVGREPFGVAITPDGRHAYITNSGSDAAPGTTVSVIDTASNTVTATIGVGREPVGVAITPDGRHAYIANFQATTLSVIHTGSG